MRWNDEVQIELPNQRHAMSACLVVDTGKSFIEQHEPGRIGVLDARVVAACGGE